MTLFADFYVPFPSSSTSSSSKGKLAETTSASPLDGLTNAEKQSLSETTGALGYREISFRHLFGM